MKTLLRDSGWMGKCIDRCEPLTSGTERWASLPEVLQAGLDS